MRCMRYKFDCALAKERLIMEMVSVLLADLCEGVTDDKTLSDRGFMNVVGTS